MPPHMDVLLLSFCYMAGTGWYAYRELKVRLIRIVLALGTPIALILTFWLLEKLI